MNERSLRIRFLISMIVAISIVAAPIELFEQPTENLLLRITIGVVLAVVVGGFYLWTLYECVRSPKLPRQLPWFVFLVVVPVVSSYIYFAATRLLLEWPHDSNNRQ